MTDLEIAEMTTRILLADDHAVFREGMGTLLQARTDFEVLALAGDGEAAWGGIERLRPDVAVLDIHMPGLSGIEVVRRVTYADSATRTLMMTMHDDPCIAREALEAGAMGYIVKNSCFEELVEAIREVAAGGMFVTASVLQRIPKV